MSGESFDESEEEKFAFESSDGANAFYFANSEVKEQFFDSLRRMFLQHRLIKGEGYTCGMCAAYPCFRNTSKKDSGLCFQAVRRCRQECNHYIYEEFPAKGGVCEVDGSRVDYEQVCHIEDMKHGRTLEDAAD